MINWKSSRLEIEDRTPRTTVEDADGPTQPTIPRLNPGLPYIIEQVNGTPESDEPCVTSRIFSHFYPILPLRITPLLPFQNPILLPCFPFSLTHAWYYSALLSLPMSLTNLSHVVSLCYSGFLHVYIPGLACYTTTSRLLPTTTHLLCYIYQVSWRERVSLRIRYARQVMSPGERTH